MLNKTKVKIWSALGLECYNKYRKGLLTEPQIIQVYKLLLNISIRFKVLDSRFNILEKAIPDLSKCLHNNQIFKFDENNHKSYDNASPDETYSFIVTQLKQIIIENTSDNDLEKTLFDDFEFEDTDLAYIILRFIANQQLQHGQTLDTTHHLL